MRAEGTLAHALIALCVTQRRAAALDVVRSFPRAVYFTVFTPHAAAVQLLLRQLVETLIQVIFLRKFRQVPIQSTPGLVLIV